MSLREDVLSVFASRLAAAGVAAGRVHRSRTAAIQVLPAVTIHPDSESASEEFLGTMSRTLTVVVSLFASGSPPDASADVDVALIESTLFADPSLGLGSEVQLMPQVDIGWDFDPEGGGTYDHTRIDMRFTVSTRV